MCSSTSESSSSDNGPVDTSGFSQDWSNNLDHVIMDYRDAPSLHSADIGWLAMMIRELEDRFVQGIVAGLDEQNFELMHMTRISDIVPVYKTVAEAFEAIQAEEQGLGMDINLENWAHLAAQSLVETTPAV